MNINGFSKLRGKDTKRAKGVFYSRPPGFGISAGDDYGFSVNRALRRHIGLEVGDYFDIDLIEGRFYIYKSISGFRLNKTGLFTCKSLRDQLNIAVEYQTLWLTVGDPVVIEGVGLCCEIKLPNKNGKK